VCGGDVYFVRHNGGAVFFDALGQPWPKHPCTSRPPVGADVADSIAHLAAQTHAQALAKRIRTATLPREDGVLGVLVEAEVTPDLHTRCRLWRVRRHDDTVSIVTLPAHWQPETLLGELVMLVPRRGQLRVLGPEHVIPYEEVSGEAT
jgi:hypothetical protein